MSGIYQIRNCLNNKIYIGSSNNLRKRFIKHKSRLNRNEHRNPHLQSSWNKYGEDNFSFEILLVCEQFELLRYEQLCLDNFIRFGIDYNIAKFASAPMRGRHHSQKTKDILRSVNQKNRTGKSNPFYGKTHSKNHMDSLKKINRKYMIENNPSYGGLSEKHKMKISERMRGSSNPRAKLTEVCVLEIRELYSTGNYTQIELGNKYNISNTIISGIVNRKTWLHV